MFVAILASTVVSNALPRIIGELGGSLAHAVRGGVVDRRLALAVLVGSRASEPVIPLGIFRNRTVSLTVVASVLVGVAMFGGTVFLPVFPGCSR